MAETSPSPPKCRGQNQLAVCRISGLSLQSGNPFFADAGIEKEAVSGHPPMPVRPAACSGQRVLSRPVHSNLGTGVFSRDTSNRRGQFGVTTWCRVENENAFSALSRCQCSGAAADN